MTGFSVVLRGYDPRQVDDLLARVEGTLGRRPLTGDPITLAELRTTRPPLAARGYDRFEVDGVLRGLRRELALHEGVEPGDEDDAGLALFFGGSAGAAPAPVRARHVHDFIVRLRGYDRRQVDELIERLQGTIGQVPLTGDPVTRHELNNVRFDVVVRGYDRQQVDTTLGRYLRELVARSPA